jgi:hypothetical protein
VNVSELKLRSEKFDDDDDNNNNNNNNNNSNNNKHNNDTYLAFRTYFGKY